MSKNRIIIILIIIAIIIIGIMIGKDDKKEEEKEQEQRNVGVTTNQIADKKKNEKFEIYNTDIKSKSGTTKITATIKNITNAKTEEQKVTIVLVDEKNNEIGTLLVIVPALESGKATEISAESLTEYENIYNFEIR